MSKLKDLPEGVRPYACHGIDFTETEGSEDWQGDCWECGKEKHTYVNPKTGQFDCKVCGNSGNAITFLSQLHKLLEEETTDEQLKELAENRGTTKVGRRAYKKQIPLKTMRKFGIVFNDITDEWLIPIYGPNGTVRDLRRYANKQMFATAGIKLQLGGEDRLAKAKRDEPIYLCEGEWDAVVLDWLLRSSKALGVVVWVPGATVLKADWGKKFKSKRVIAIYDNDRAGDQGQTRCAKIIGPHAKSLKFVCWPDTKPKGYDLRDHVIKLLATRSKPDDILDDISQLIREDPRRGKVEVDPDSSPETPAEWEGEPPSLQEVVDVFKQHVLVNDEMIQTIKVVLAVCLSNEMKSDPLWVYLVGPPGSGKTLVLSALQTSPRCKFVSTITAHSLVSGWQGSGGDPSLIPKLAGKTFIAKDFTEILTMPVTVQDEIFSTLRGAYDGSVQRPFGNGVTREYENCYFSMLAGVTHAIHGSPKASLGERFLKFQISALKGKAADDIVRAAISSVGKEKKMEEAIQNIVGHFLCRDIDLDNLPTLSPEIQDRLVALVQLIAAMRAQVERDWRGEEVAYRPTAETGTRLAKQLVKLAMMVAVVEGNATVEESTLAIVEKAAYDTASGFHLDIIEAFMKIGGEATKAEIAAEADIPTSTLARRLDDLLILKAVIPSMQTTTKKGGRPAKLFKVNGYIAKLWRRAKGIKDEEKQRGKGRKQSDTKEATRRRRRSRSA